MSRCISDWSKQLYEDIDDEDEDEFVLQLETLKEIYSYTRREQLLGGDLIEVSKIIVKVVENFVNKVKTGLEPDEEKENAIRINKVRIFKMLAKIFEFDDVFEDFSKKNISKFCSYLEGLKN